MKRILSIILSLIILTSYLPLSALAVTDAERLELTLTVNGESIISVQPGDEIEVSYTMNNVAGQAFDVSNHQAQIKVDESFFQYTNEPSNYELVKASSCTYEPKSLGTMVIEFLGMHISGARPATFEASQIIAKVRLKIRDDLNNGDSCTLPFFLTGVANGFTEPPTTYAVNEKSLTVFVGDAPSQMHTIVYKDGETTLSTGAYAQGTVITLNHGPESTSDKKFEGWMNDEGNVLYAGDSYIVTGDAVFNALWVNKYTLHFETNGGSAVADKVEWENNDIVLANYTTKKTGYTFAGWFEDSALTTPVAESFKLTSDKTIYAKWTKKSTDDSASGGGGGGGASPVEKHTITFKNVDGTSIESAKYEADTIVDLSKHNPKKEGYTFDGWYLDKELTNMVTTIKLTDDTVLYAKWSKSDEPVPSKPNYKPSILTSEHYAYIVGRDGGMIAPESDITRAEVATIIYRLLNEDERNKAKTNENVFTDINENDWFNTAVSTLAGLELVNGRTADTFAPNAFITRAELATIFARMVEIVYDGKVLFSDVSGHWAESYINEAATARWIVGYDGLFRPDDNITRAEVMTLVNRVLNREPESKADLLDGMTNWKDNADENAWYYLAVQEATNSHTYEAKSDGIHEKWTALTENPDWSKLEN